MKPVKYRFATRAVPVVNEADQNSGAIVAAQRKHHKGCKVAGGSLLCRFRGLFHKGLKIAKKQMAPGYGGVLSFGLRVNHDTHHRFVSHLQIITVAVSLGA